MFALALRSIRQRPGRFAATLLASFLGAVIIMAFNSLQDTAAGNGVDHTSSESLSTAASMVGGYGALLVFFAVASTLTVNVRQRDAEIELLRTSGATPAQIKRMVVGEAAVVALVGSLLAIGPAMLGGHILLGLFKDSGQIADGVDLAFGPIALMSGIGITLLASVGAAFLAVRRAMRARSGRRHAPRRRLRTWSGYGALGLGAALCLSAFAMGDAGPEAMGPPAYGSILLSAGFAVFSAPLLGGLLTLVAGPLEATGAGYLTVRNLRRRAGELTGVLMPLILFVGISTATLYMQAIENDHIEASGLTRTVDDKNLETLNFVVVGIIAVFACVMLVNTLYAATSYRRREFGQQRLAGATPRQILWMVAVESGVVAVTGVLFGSLAAVAGLVPFSLARTDGMPQQGLGIWLAVAAVAVAATVGTGVLTARRQLRASAVEAVALVA